MASKVFKDRRTLEVLTYFEDIKLLVTNLEKKKPKLPLNVLDALWVANNAEPRILELLPSAIINYPNDWKDTEKLPKKIKEIIKDILSNTKPKISTYKGINVVDMFKWANLGNIDKRRKAPDQKKKLCSFRLNQKIIDLLKQKAKEHKLSQADYISLLIERT